MKGIDSLASDEQQADHLSVRAAAEHDAAAIKTLYSQLAPDVSNVDRDYPVILRDPNAICLLIEAQGELIGMAICYVRTSLSSGKKMIIDDIVIDRDYRGQGFGRWVVEHCVNLAKARSLDCIELACSLSRRELHRFYERIGLRHRMRLYSLFLEHE